MAFDRARFDSALERARLGIDALASAEGSGA